MHKKVEVNSTFAQKNYGIFYKKNRTSNFCLQIIFKQCKMYSVQMANYAIAYSLSRTAFGSDAENKIR